MTIRHDRSCDAQAIGRRVLATLAVPTDPDQVFTLGWFFTDLDAFRTDCTCISRQLNRMNEELRLARKGARAGRAGCHADVDRLLRERAAFLEAVQAS